MTRAQAGAAGTIDSLIASGGELASGLATQEWCASVRAGRVLCRARDRWLTGLADDSLRDFGVAHEYLIASVRSTQSGLRPQPR